MGDYKRYKILYDLLYLFFGLIMILPFLLIRKNKNVLVWGPIPIISNKYWSSAMKELGYNSVTLMNSFYSINNKDDFDIYFDDLVPRFIKFKILKKSLSPLFAFLYVLKNASVMNIPFSGGPLGNTSLWKLEGYLFKKSGIKVVILPYGADFYIYSTLNDSCLHHGLLLSYPKAAINEEDIKKHIVYWTKNADFILTGFQLDGVSRWDCSCFSAVCINSNDWVSKEFYSNFNGKNNTVKILHSPNHRGFKGTEFLIQIVDELKLEGIKVELILMEGIPNQLVKRRMKEVDILAEQFIATGYALNAIEGMASGLPVLSNLDNEFYTRLFRRYCYLNECPILSTTPETLKDNLRVLIKNPQLRKELGEAGRKYVEKYHSYEAAQYIFGSIYKKILDNEDIDLMNLFHPLKSEL
jgi:glycosyltransferase involved in cell wall biosynthesis